MIIKRTILTVLLPWVTQEAFVDNVDQDQTALWSLIYTIHYFIKELQQNYCFILTWMFRNNKILEICTKGVESVCMRSDYTFKQPDYDLNCPQALAGLRITNMNKLFYLWHSCAILSLFDCINNPPVSPRSQYSMNKLENVWDKKISGKINLWLFSRNISSSFSKFLCLPKELVMARSIGLNYKKCRSRSA